MSDRVYLVATPENLPLHFERAGLATRTLALCLDALAMLALMQVGWWLLTPLHELSHDAANAAWIVAVFLVQWWYAALAEWRFGRTLGKRLCGLRVVDARGLPLSFSSAVIRNLLRLADLLPMLHLAGAVTCLLDRHGRRLGDLAAQTVVVREASASSASRAQTMVARSRPFAATALADELSRDERELIQRLCSARDRLPLAERVQLCDALVAHLIRSYRLEAPGHLSSERILLGLDETLRSIGTTQES